MTVGRTLVLAIVFFAGAMLHDIQVRAGESAAVDATDAGRWKVQDRKPALLTELFYEEESSMFKVAMHVPESLVNAGGARRVCRSMGWALLLLVGLAITAQASEQG